MNQWRKALGILLGLQLSVNDDWEVYTEFEEFGGWFSDYSSAWLQVVGRSDSQLGLVAVGGKEVGEVKEMLENWERRTKELFRDVFDEFDLVMITARFSKLEVAEEMMKQAVKTAL